MCYMQSLSQVSCVTKSGGQHGRSCHTINLKARIRQSLLLTKLARYFSKHEETGRIATVMQSLVLLFCVYSGVHSFCALLFKTATYECVQCL
jgi:hypothetical protein